jgi:prepilin-type N-terminal cleavage/methylation domain-containing protein
LQVETRPVGPHPGDDSRLLSRTVNHNAGFTLVELIVVISLLGLLLFFAMPRLPDTFRGDPGKAFGRRMLAEFSELKRLAVQHQRRYVLNLSLDTRRVWITDESMPEEARLLAAQNAFAIPAGINLVDVEYPLKGKISDGRAEINFYPQGYSDPALIHMEGPAGQPLTFVIEPFLPTLRIYAEHRGYED